MDTEVAMKPPGGGGHRDHHHRGGDQEMVRLTAAVDGVESARRVGSSDASDGDDEETASGDKAAPWWIRRGPCADAVALTQTMTYTLGFGVLGLLVGLIGPSLPTLRTNAGVAYERLGVVFLARWIGGVAGSAIGGFALDAAPRSHAPMCVGIVVAVIGAVRIPAARTLNALLLAFLVTDLGLGVLIVYGNTLGTWANARNPGPAVNVINGGFGLGALVAPLIVYAALDVSPGVGVTGAYWTVAVAAIAVAMYSSRVVAPARPEEGKEDDEEEEEGGKEEVDKEEGDGGAEGAAEGAEVAANRRASSSTDSPIGPGAATAATAVFIALVVGVETSFGAFLVSYCIGVGGEVGEKEADLATTAFWTTFTLGRFAAAGLVARTRPAATLSGHCACVCVALAVVLGGRGSRVSVWFGSVLFGAGMSSVFAAAVAHLHELLGPGGMSGGSGGWISAGASSGTLVMLATSQALGTPDAVMATLLALSVCAMGTMVAVWTRVGWRRAFGSTGRDERARRR